MPELEAVSAASAISSLPFANDNVPVRLSGTLADRPGAKTMIGGYYYATDVKIVYESTGGSWEKRSATPPKHSIAGEAHGSMKDRPVAAKMIGWTYHVPGTGTIYEAFPSINGGNGEWATINRKSVGRETDYGYGDKMGAAVDLTLAELGDALSSRYGLQLQSTGDNAIVATVEEPFEHIIAQTLDASPSNPYLVKLDQFIQEEFTGDGQLDLLEREAARRANDGVADGTDIITSETFNWQEGDEGKTIKIKKRAASQRAANPRASNPRWLKILAVQNAGTIQVDDEVDEGSDLILVMDGEGWETIATKNGFDPGEMVGTPNSPGAWSRFSKVITSDKIYKVVFVPGTTGHGHFSLNITKLGR